MFGFTGLELWLHWFNWWKNLSGIVIIISQVIEECLLFGFRSNSDVMQVLNFCILQAKYYIYIQCFFNNKILDLYTCLNQLKQAFIVFGRDISLVLRTHETSLHKNNSHDLHRVITHSLVLVIIPGAMVRSTSYIIQQFCTTYFELLWCYSEGKPAPSDK